MLYRPLDKLEPRLRRLLLLDDKPEPSGLRFGEPDERGFVEMLIAPEEEVDQDIARWHREPRRARALDAAIFALRRFDPKDIPLKAKLALVDRPRRERELKEARRLEWHCYHYDTPGQSVHLDGYLTLPSGERYSLDVSTVAYQEIWAKEAWQSGEVYRTGRDTDHRPGVATAVVPSPVLTPAIVEEALKRWYMARFEFEQGHWALIEKTLPEITVDGSFWAWPDDPKEREDAKRAAKEAEERLAEIVPQTELEERTWRRFGQLVPKAKEPGPRSRESGLAERAQGQ